MCALKISSTKIERLNTKGSLEIKKFLQDNLKEEESNDADRWHEYLVLREKIYNLSEFKELLRGYLILKLEIPSGILIKLFGASNQK